MIPIDDRFTHSETCDSFSSSVSADRYVPIPKLNRFSVFRKVPFTELIDSLVSFTNLHQRIQDVHPCQRKKCYHQRCAHNSFIIEVLNNEGAVKVGTMSGVVRKGIKYEKFVDGCHTPHLLRVR